MAEPAPHDTRAGSRRVPLFTPPFAAVINHLLDGASWARERLKPHAGKVLAFDVAPFSIALIVTEAGSVADAARDAEADVKFALAPWVALRFLHDPEQASRQVSVDGDTSIARDILYVARHLRWDAEEDLSRVFGDMAAHRMVRTAGDFLRWQRNSAQQLARSAAAYWTEEQPLIASKYEVENFMREVDTLRDDVERAEKRIELLAARKK